MKNVEDIYALSPMQEVMLMHTASHAGDDVLFNQFCYEIHGELDTTAFELAWRKLLERHSILRSAFLWEGLKNPVQVVREKVTLPFEFLDWCGEPESLWHSLRRQFCEADRKRGFDPRKAPLMRLVLMRFGDEQYYFIWSSHHLLLDRWCLQIVFNDLFRLYESARSGTSPDLEDAAQFRAYIDWIKHQDESKAENFWRTTLAGYSTAVSLTKVATDSKRDEQSIHLSDDDHAGLRALATSCGVTLSVLMQGAWSLTLNRLLGIQDIVFGAVVAGRPADLRGVESTIGSFVNNVPVRVRLPRDETLRGWLQTLQQAQHERGAFEYIAPTSIQRWSGLPVGQPMFDTLIVTLGSTGISDNAGFELTPMPGSVSTAYPLTLSIDESGKGLAVSVALQAGRKCKIALNELLASYKTTLQDLALVEPGLLISAIRSFSGTLEKADLHASSAYPVPELTGKTTSIANQAGREEANIEDMQDVLRIEWQQALGIDAIGPDDDFFKLGGSSLQAATLHASIESATRKSLPILTLFQSTTLSGMAQTLVRDNWPLRSDLAIGLRTTGSKAPLFCIASPEVNTVGYALLARHQDKDRPIYVLQAPPEAGAMRRLSPHELPDMARQYLQELRRIQPRGPYYLLGMCTGSQLVLEIARQLDDDGEQTEFAGIINTWAHYTVSRWYQLQRLMNTGSWYAGRLKGVWRLGPKEQLAELRRVIQGRLGRLPSHPAHDAEVDDTPTASDPMISPANEQDDVDPWIEEFGWAHKDPQTDKYRGTLTVFRIRRQQFWRTGEADLGWGKHAQHVNVEHLPGKTHESVLREPHVQIVGQRIADRIKESETRDEE